MHHRPKDLSISTEISAKKILCCKLYILKQKLDRGVRTASEKE